MRSVEKSFGAGVDLGGEHRDEPDVGAEGHVVARLRPDEVLRAGEHIGLS